ncbi:MAG: cupredoxin domain-containing protein [bacterium]
MSKCFAIAAALVPLTLAGGVARAQSLLDRPDNISTDWVGNTGTLYFNFVHRFSTSAAPERKVTNFPTFLIATGLGSRALVGLNYATNSSLAARYPNEYEFFGRYAIVQQEDGGLFDLGGQVDYNLAVKGVDGELSIARREGPVRVVAVTRMVADTFGGDKRRFSFGGGGTLRFGRFIAIAGDAATISNRAAGEKVAWSAGLHIALPNTPHTLSLHVSNATTSTIQGLTRGGDTKRYGFEFTIPIHVSRFFSNPEPTTGAPETQAMLPPTATDSAAAAPPTRTVAPMTSPTPTPVTSPTPTTADTSAKAPPTRAATPTPSPTRTAEPSQQAPKTAARPAAPKLLNARMKGQAFIPATIEISAGTTVNWKNLDALIHTVTAVDKSFNSGVIAADGSYSHTFTKPGTYPIFCLAHPFMKATVVVK